MSEAATKRRRFTDRVALVTGGSRGMGADLARALAAEGSRVVAVGRDHRALDSVVDAIQRDGGQAVGLAADLVDAAAVERLREEAAKAFGPPDLIAAFAGGSGNPEPTLGVSPDRWREVVDGQLATTFLTLRAFLPAMVERRRGAVVTMASSAARQPGQSSAAYAVGKAGVIALTQHLSYELGPSAVRLNCLAPAAIVTDRLAAQPQEVRDQIAKDFPLRRLGQPRDVTEAALYLLSDDASWITGVTLDVAGGRIMR